MLRGRHLSVLALAASVAGTAGAQNDPMDRVFLRFGGMRPGSGVATGLEYRDTHFGNGFADLRLQSQVSIRLYQRHEVEVILPHVKDPRLFVELLTAYRSHTQIDYFGRGQDSNRDDHSTFRVDGLTSFATIGFRPQRNTQLGARAGYIQSVIKSGTDGRRPSVEERFDPSELPGLTHSPDFLTIGGFFRLDRRDDFDEPQHGGLVELQTVRYMNVGPGDYGFDELDLEAQYVVPASSRTTLAFRARSVFTRPLDGAEIPFFLLPSLGGSDYLHAFENDRFRDRHTLVLNYEVRYRATPGIRLELFVDAGQVAPRLDELKLDALTFSYGGAVRYKLGRSVLAGLSMGLGREGIRWAFSGNFRF